MDMEQPVLATSAHLIYYPLNFSPAALDLSADAWKLWLLSQIIVFTHKILSCFKF
jgi:hypothetical protein